MYQELNIEKVIQVYSFSRYLRVINKGSWDFISLFSINFIYFLKYMKPLSVELACLLGIQNEIQVV